ncbi:MAG: class I SAM-dependent methyltransferase, partial [Pyrinomonadaceae bacterium]
IYLFDQIQKGQFTPGMKILDAGCGGGRNIVWLMRNGFDVFAVDKDERAVAAVRDTARLIAPDLPMDNFQTASLDAIPFAEQTFDWVICNAVMHFAANRAQFDSWLAEMWRVLKPGGVFFARLASSIGIEKLLIPTSNGRYMMPDGSERFIVDEQMLRDSTASVGGQFLEPIKTTNVENLRCMTTWVVVK